jgi:hypothetical protein
LSQWWCGTSQLCQSLLPDVVACCAVLALHMPSCAHVEQSPQNAMPALPAAGTAVLQHLCNELAHLTLKGQLRQLSVLQVANTGWRLAVADELQAQVDWHEQVRRDKRTHTEFQMLS